MDSMLARFVGARGVASCVGSELTVSGRRARWYVSIDTRCVLSGTSIFSSFVNILFIKLFDSLASDLAAAMMQTWGNMSENDRRQASYVNIKFLLRVNTSLAEYCII